MIGSKSLFYLSLALTIYNLGYFFEVISKSLDNKIIWYGIEYFGIASLPVLWFIFALNYSDYNEFVKSKKSFLLIVIPIITVIMVWTTKYHNFFVKFIGISSQNILPEILKINGPWYWIHVIYSYILIFLGSAIILKTVLNLPSFHIKMGIIVIFGALIPVVSSILYIFQIFPIKTFDFIGIACAISAIFLAWSLYKVKVFQIVPIIRDRIFDNISEGHIVIDTSGSILDANKTAQKILDFDMRKVIGKNIIEIFKKKELLKELINFFEINFILNENVNLLEKNIQKELINDFKSFLLNILDNNKVFKIIIEGKIKYYLINILPIKKVGKTVAGYLMSLKDITTSWLAQQNLLESSTKLKNFNTKIYNLGICNNEDEIFGIISDTALEILNFKCTCYLEYKDNLLLKKYNSNNLLEQLFANQDFLNVALYLHNNIFKEDEISTDKNVKINEFNINNFNFFNNSLINNKLMKILEGRVKICDVYFNIENNLIEHNNKNINLINNRLVQNQDKKNLSVLCTEFDNNLLEILKKDLGLKDFLNSLIIPFKNIGVFVFLSFDEYSINEDSLRLCEILAAQGIVALKRVLLQNELREQAQIDPLTNVYNRRYFDTYIEKEIERAKRYNYPITFIMLDIDRFKEVNDKYGHPTGDLVLKSVANILLGQTRKIDSIIRFGGDEFLLVLPNFLSENLNSFMDRIDTAINEWRQNTNILDFSIDFSFGISKWDPSESPGGFCDINELLETADILMYENKRKKYIN